MTISVRKFAFNKRNRVDGAVLLRSLSDESVRLAFLDPQYRTGLNKLKFGNEGSRQKARYALPQMSDGMIGEFVAETERALKHSGYLMLWVDKFLITSGHWRKWLPFGTSLCSVDLIVWNKVIMGMGRRSRYMVEFLIVLQKGPTKAKATWKDHAIRDFWIERRPPKDAHAHAKPLELTRRLIEATTKRGDVVLDPCAGSYGVLDICRATGRKFIGGDIA